MQDTEASTAQQLRNTRNAQSNPYKEAIRQAPREVTPQNVQAMWQLFAPAHLARSHQAPRIIRDHRYGVHDRQRLDVHLPAEGPPQGAPVFLFVQGGGFVAGDKQTEGTPYYDHVGTWAVANGMVGVTMNYRLAPGDSWPAGAEDVAAAVVWLREHVSEAGGNPERIIVMGHSAGASHVAGYLVGHGGRSPQIAGAVLLSGIYDLQGIEKSPVVSAYYGADPIAYPERQSLTGLVDVELPVLYGIAQYDPPDLHRQAGLLIAAHQTRHGVLPRFIQVEGHNHVSEIVSLGIDDAILSAALLQFIDSI